MIPKTIHYCWFGRNPLPELAQKCIASWKQYCPDYEIIEWNEDNFDIGSAPLYVRQAYAARKWAFVTDYVRLYALISFGGVYMDTDVEVIKPLDGFLSHCAFSGFENDTDVPTGIMACEKGFPLFEELLRYYNDAEFQHPDRQDTTVTNVVIITEALLKKGLLPNNSFQEIEGFALYPKDYFCPKSYIDGQIYLTENTFTIHHFAASWQSKSAKNHDVARWNYFKKKKSSRVFRFFHRKLSEEQLERIIRQSWVNRTKRREKRHYLLHSPFLFLRKLIGDDRFEAIRSKIRN